MFNVKSFSLSGFDHFNSAKIVFLGHVLLGFRKEVEFVLFSSNFVVVTVVIVVTVQLVVQW
jgi:hypothetical protein